MLDHEDLRFLMFLIMSLIKWTNLWCSVYIPSWKWSNSASIFFIYFYDIGPPNYSSQIWLSLLPSFYSSIYLFAIRNSTVHTYSRERNESLNDESSGWVKFPGFPYKHIQTNLKQNPHEFMSQNYRITTEQHSSLNNSE